MKFGGKKFQIIILGLSHKVCCLLPSPSYCNMVRFTADSFPVDCQSTIIFQRGKCGQGESVARVRSKYRWLGTSKALRSSGPLPTLPLGLVLFRVVFTFGLPCFLLLVSMTMGHCNASPEPPKYKEQKKQTQGAGKSSRLKLCRPKFVVKSPKCCIMLKD